jgi:flagellar hook-basal body complex protein FliE
VDLKLKPFDFNQALARAGLNAQGQPLARAGATEAAGGSFRTAMADALKGVSDTQLDAQRLQREVALDNPTVSLEETMIAMQKSQLGFQAAVQVRNRLVSAYTDIMNMQV